MSKKTIFNYLDNICMDKVGLDMNDTGYSPYMINRFVSMSNMLVPMVNEINKYQIPNDVHFEYLACALPKRKQFFKYIKKSKEHKNVETLIERLSMYYEIGHKEARQYLDILTTEQSQTIYDLYETR